MNYAVVLVIGWAALVGGFIGSSLFENQSFRITLVSGLLVTGCIAYVFIGLLGSI